MLQSLLEIDEISKDTAEAQLPDGQTAYAGYFFARFSKDNRQAAENAVRAYQGTKKEARYGKIISLIMMRAVK